MNIIFSNIGFKYLSSDKDGDIPLTSAKQVLDSKSISEIIEYKTINSQCSFKVKLKERIDEIEFGWINITNLDKKCIIEWLTKSKLNYERSVNPTRDEVTSEELIKTLNEKVEAEINNNLNRFIIDQDGNPCFVEDILAVTNDLNKIEFVVKFKYSR